MRSCSPRRVPRPPWLSLPPAWGALVVMGAAPACLPSASSSGAGPHVPNPPRGSPPLDPSPCASEGWGGRGNDPGFGNKNKSFHRAVCSPVPAGLGVGWGPSWVWGFSPWSIDPVGVNAALSDDWNLPTRRGLVPLGTMRAGSRGAGMCGLGVSSPVPPQCWGGTGGPAWLETTSTGRWAAPGLVEGQ